MRSRTRTREPIADRFWRKVDKTETCWLWTASRNRGGYGQFGDETGLPGHMDRAHRMSWKLTRGPIPDGLLVLHKCDNPACVNPEHLYLGTKRDNARDALERGQMSTGPSHPVPRGTDHWNAKISDAQAAEIRKRRAQGELLRILAAAYGVSEAHISRIAKGMSRAR